MAAAPAWIFYTTDLGRVEQLNLLEKKIVNTDNQKNINIIREQLQQKLNTLTPLFNRVSDEGVGKKYSGIYENSVLTKANYTKTKDAKSIKTEYIKSARLVGGETALLDTKGNIIDTNSSSLRRLNFTIAPKFLTAVNTDKKNILIKDINYSEGTANYYMPIFDVREHVVAVLFAREKFSDIPEAIRKEILPKAASNGATFVVDDTGKIIIHNDIKKENTDVGVLNPQLKFLSDSTSENTGILEDVKYDNTLGFFAYAKNLEAKVTVCVFTAAADYSDLIKKSNTYSNALLDKTNLVLIGSVFFLAFIMIVLISTAPFKPVYKVVAALAHVDEEGFEELLPREKKGEYKKLIDSILILRGRVKSSEENANKLSEMAKELEEELSKESTRADREISELQEALKKLGGGKGNQDEESTDGPLTIKKIMETQKGTKANTNMPGKEFKLPESFAGKPNTPKPAENKEKLDPPSAKPAEDKRPDII